MHHADQKMRRVFRFRLERGIPLRQRIGNFKWSPINAGVPRAGERRAAGGTDFMFVPRTLVTHHAVEFLPALNLFLVVDQRKNRARIDLDSGVPREFQHAQRVRNFFVAPLIAADDGDAQSLNLRRLQHH